MNIGVARLRAARNSLALALACALLHPAGAVAQPTPVPTTGAPIPVDTSTPKPEKTPKPTEAPTEAPTEVPTQVPVPAGVRVVDIPKRLDDTALARLDNELAEAQRFGVMLLVHVTGDQRMDANDATLRAFADRVMSGGGLAALLTPAKNPKGDAAAVLSALSQPVLVSQDAKLQPIGDDKLKAVVTGLQCAGCSEAGAAEQPWVPQGAVPVATKEDILARFGAAPNSSFVWSTVAAGDERVIIWLGQDPSVALTPAPSASATATRARATREAALSCG